MINSFIILVNSSDALIPTNVPPYQVPDTSVCPEDQPTSIPGKSELVSGRV